VPEEAIQQLFGKYRLLYSGYLSYYQGHYYAGKNKGYKYLNDTYILNVNTNRWSVNIYNLEK